MTRDEELDWLYRLKSEIYVYMPKEWLIPMHDALDAAINSLEQEPKTGYWEYKEIANTTITGYLCSQCHIGSSKPYDYCPSCGSYNRGEPLESEE